MGAMILAEIRDFSRFDSPDKILAYAGASPSTYQSGQLESSYSQMEKRGSRHLRFALIYAMEKSGKPYIKAAYLFLFYNISFEHRYTMLCLSCAFQGTSISEMHFRNSFIKFSLQT